MDKTQSEIKFGTFMSVPILCRGCEFVGSQVVPYIINVLTGIVEFIPLLPFMSSSRELVEC